MREFGQYRIESLIGRGGMGEVHRAYDTRRDRPVALKLLPSVLSEDPEYQRRFRRESYTVARLREPHVIPIHDYGEIDDQLYIDMRLVDGRSLAALLGEHGALPPARAVQLISQVAEALDAAHADGLVHRDVKPSNVLVTSNDFVYVVDFGIAHAIGQTRSHMTRTGATIGTLDYMAPERFENRTIDCRTDVYSLACVLHECLTGVKPYPGADLPALMYGHLFAEPPKPSVQNPAVPAAFDAVIAKGMAKDPNARFGTAGELAAAARAVLGTDAASRAGTDAFAASAPHPAEAPAPAVAAAAAGAVAASEAVTVARPAFAAHTPPPAAYGPGPQTPPPGGPPPGWPTAAVPLPASPEPPPAPKKGRNRLAIGAIAVLAAVVLVLGTLLVIDRTGSPEPAGSAAPASGLGPLGPVPGAQAAAPAVANSVAKPTAGEAVNVGATPGYMELTPDGRTALIANRGAGVLTVFDTTRNQALGTIPVPDGGPQFVAFSPDGTRAYVSIFNTDRTVNEVGVLDMTTMQFLARVPTGVRPFALDVSPDGKTVYVPNHDSGSITVIDTATNTVRSEIKVAPNPHWLDISDDGTRVYAANHESNVVSVIDTADNAVLAMVPVGSAPHSIVVHPKKPIVLNVNYDSSSVSVIDRNTNAVIATVPTGSHPQDITLSADGKYAYLATVDENAIEVLDTTSFTITARVPTGRSPTSVAIAPDGRQAYVTNLND
ncbi:MAG: protein kinase, partial [Pseudonocardia sp.]